MRISELSARSGVSVATIKYYLRERVLPEGERTSPTQATYGEPHLRRLGVIRALVDAGVGIAGVRNVIAVLENPPEAPGALLGAASSAVNPADDDARLDLGPARALVARFGGEPDECAPGQIAAVARALTSLDRAGFAVPEPVLAAYVEHLAAIGEAELEATPADSAEEAVRYVVLGTVLVEPLILALRRVAEQMAATRRLGGG